MKNKLLVISILLIIIIIICYYLFNKPNNYYEPYVASGTVYNLTNLDDNGIVRADLDSNSKRDIMRLKTFEGKNVEIYIQEGVERINGFFNNSSISSMKNNIIKIRFPSTLKEIGTNEFKDYTNLTTVEFPLGIEYIGPNAFRGTGIKNVTLPANVNNFKRESWNHENTGNINDWLSYRPFVIYNIFQPEERGTYDEYKNRWVIVYSNKYYLIHDADATVKCSAIDLPSRTSTTYSYKGDENRGSACSSISSTYDRMSWGWNGWHHVGVSRDGGTQTARGVEVSDSKKWDPDTCGVAGRCCKCYKKVWIKFYNPHTGAKMDDGDHSKYTSNNVPDNQRYGTIVNNDDLNYKYLFNLNYHINRVDGTLITSEMLRNIRKARDENLFPFEDNVEITFEKRVENFQNNENSNDITCKIVDSDVWAYCGDQKYVRYDVDSKSTALAEYMGVRGGYDFSSADEAKAKCAEEGLQLCNKDEVIAGAKTKAALQNVCSTGWTEDAPRGWYSVKGSHGCGGDNTWNTWAPETGKGSAHCCKPDPDAISTAVSDCNSTFKDKKCNVNSLYKHQMIDKIENYVNNIENVQIANNMESPTLYKIEFNGILSRLAIANSFGDYASKEIVYIGDKVTSLEASLFENNTSLQTIIISPSVKHIKDNCFKSCTNLKNVFFYPVSELISIGNSAFQGCASLANIHLPDSLQLIGYKAFKGCSANLQVYINPSSDLKMIGMDAFDESIQNIVLPIHTHFAPAHEYSSKKLINMSLLGTTNLTNSINNYLSTRYITQTMLIPNYNISSLPAPTDYEVKIIRDAKWNVDYYHFYFYPPKINPNNIDWTRGDSHSSAMRSQLEAYRTTYKNISFYSTKNASNINTHIMIVGGGGSGGGSMHGDRAAGGGGGGQVTMLWDYKFSNNDTVDMTIGHGHMHERHINGAVVSNGRTGWNTDLMLGGTTYTALAGYGGYARAYGNDGRGGYSGNNKRGGYHRGGAGGGGGGHETNGGDSSVSNLNYAGNGGNGIVWIDNQGYGGGGGGAVSYWQPGGK